MSDAIREARQAIAHLADPAAFNDPARVERQANAFAKSDDILAPLLALQTPAPGVAEAVGALRKIAELRFAENANEPFDDALDIADAALATIEAQGRGAGERVRHVKRGTEYEVLHRGAKLQVSRNRDPENDDFPRCREGESLVIYSGTDGKLWAREESEFDDGRFVSASTPPSPAPDARGGAKP